MAAFKGYRMELTTGLGWFAAALVFASFYLRTISSLRLMAAFSNVAFIVYALKVGAVPILVLHALLLPLNVHRLLQNQRLKRSVQRASAINAGMLLLPLMRQTWHPAGHVLFRKDDASDNLFYILDGHIELVERTGIRGPGELIGVMGVFTKDKKRLDTAIARTAVQIGQIPTDRVREAILHEPELSRLLLQTISERALKNAPTAPSAQVAMASAPVAPCAPSDHAAVAHAMVPHAS